ncbi:MAG TPA: hypothetical protein DCM40_24740 [Maribacter sp.]|nr:hypothetical protein [Maribacter sp.]
MAGILDNKSRVLDIIITREGKRQMASGKLVPRFISFSDSKSFYEFDPVSGSSDASERVYFESFSQQKDSVIFESDDSGQLIRYDGGPLTINREALFTKILTGTNQGLVKQVSGSSEFSSIANDLLSGSLENFNKLDLIGDEQDFEDEELRLDTESISFMITQTTPLKSSDKTSAYIDEIEPLFLDKRLSHAINFAYLPPSTERKIPGRERSMRRRLGEYPDIRQSRRPYSFMDIINDLGGNTKRVNGKVVKQRNPQKTKKTIQLVNTSRQSNMIFQIFESNNENGTIKKLDVINAGPYRTPRNSNRDNAEVYFAGKIFLTKSGLPTFVNIFTIIID